MRAVADDFAQHGREALVRAREADPLGYSKMIAGLMPKEIEAKRPLEELTDEELHSAVALLREMLAAQKPEVGTKTETGEQTGQTRQ